MQTKTRCLQLATRNSLLASFDHKLFALLGTRKTKHFGEFCFIENCGVPFQVMVIKYSDYVTIYIPLDSHGDITELLDAILGSLEIHIQIVACFSEFIPQ